MGQGIDVDWAKRLLPARFCVINLRKSMILFVYVLEKRRVLVLGELIVNYT